MQCAQPESGSPGRLTCNSIIFAAPKFEAPESVATSQRQQSLATAVFADQCARHETIRSELNQRL
jgi:hypothetical protein